MTHTKKVITVLLTVLLLAGQTYAKVEAMFHPYDDTFSAIVERLKKAESRIDMALYNLEASDKSEIIAYLMSSPVQKRIKSGELTIRLIFEGYASKEENIEKMLKLEEIGIDARALGSSKKMHHKFAIIDGHKASGSVITGSANWSLGSLRNYNESILFFDEEGEMAQEFQTEFDFLWNVSKEIGKKGKKLSYDFEETAPGIGKVAFNRHNFEVARGSLRKKRGDLGYHLTQTIVEAIDNADQKLEIATTRLKLRPIYDAIVRAAKRGVEIKIVVTMGEYEWASKRKKMAIKSCPDAYDRSCSSGVNYAALLAKENYEGSDNVDVRLKFFHLNTQAYLNRQMHSKYLIADDKVVLSGSFNWSYSSEFNHIENIVSLNEKEASGAIKDFNNDFDRLWNQNREDLSSLHSKISTVKENNEKMNCGFEPMTLEYKEIDGLLKRGRRMCL